MSVQRIGRYNIIREVGRGSMGAVYEAQDTQNNFNVALKVLYIDQMATGANKRQAIERFRREVKAAGSIVHPNIAQVYDFGEVDGRHYLAMEFCTGITLREMLRFERKISDNKLKDIADQLLSALEAAHAVNIVHRDIKPDNIIIGQNGHIKLTDFGIAKSLNDGTLTQTNQAIGSPAYMSPEQVIGSNVDARTDLFSVGVVLYECLSGNKPFDGNTVTTITHKIINVQPEPLLGVSGYWAGVINKALSKDVAGRYQTASEMRYDIVQQRMPVLNLPKMQSVVQLSQLVQLNVGSKVNNGPMPEELKCWNWGGFFLGWIWAVQHKVWIGLLCLVPALHIVMAVILGIKGSEWAWQNRKFSSAAQFKAVQLAWTKWGIVWVLLPILGTIGITVLSILAPAFFNPLWHEFWSNFFNSAKGSNP